MAAPAQRIRQGIVPVIAVQPFAPAFAGALARLRQDSVDVLEAADDAQAGEWIEQASACVLLLYLREPSEMRRFLEWIKRLKAPLQQRRVQIVTVSAFGTHPVIDSMDELGFSETVKEPVNDKSLHFKIERHLRTVIQVASRHLVPIGGLISKKVVSGNAAPKRAPDAEGEPRVAAVPAILEEEPRVALMESAPTRAELEVALEGEAEPEEPAVSVAVSDGSEASVAGESVVVHSAGEDIGEGAEPNPFASAENALSKAFVAAGLVGGAGEIAESRRDGATGGRGREPSLSPLAFGFLVSEVMGKLGRGAEEIAARSCRYLSGACGGSRVELWRRAGSEWVLLGFAGGGIGGSLYGDDVRAFDRDEPAIGVPYESFSPRAGVAVAPVLHPRSRDLVGALVIASEDGESRAGPEYAAAAGVFLAGVVG